VARHPQARSAPTTAQYTSALWRTQSIVGHVADQHAGHKVEQRDAARGGERI
jgi:hypothetical protein